MADAILFAPKIRPIQPAFATESENGMGILKVYFTLPFTRIGISLPSIEIKIIDPAKESASGNNIIYQMGGVTCNGDINTEQFISISHPFNLSVELDINRYYQVQIRYVDSEGTSAWSQISLIKRVADFEPSLSSNILLPIQDFLYIQGDTGIDGPMLQNCYFYNPNNKESIIGEIFKNQFYIPLTEDLFITNFITGMLYLETIEGYIKMRTITLRLLSGGEPQNKNLILSWNKTSASIEINNISEGDFILVKKEPSKKIWTIVRKNAPSLVLDEAIQGGKIYEYGLFSLSMENETFVFYDYAKAEFETDFEDIFLLDKDIMLALRYDTSLTGVKYITQESITNTLGGKYPLVRKNGKTKYKQFNISGLLYLDYYTNENLFCSNSDLLSYEQSPNGDLLTTTNAVWFQDEGSLYLSAEEKNKIGNLNNYSVRSIEKILRQKAEEFLTNSQLKIFKSYDEGPMIVYLSNITFSPKKQLNNHIYDFSAQVTEICELNLENLEKYNLGSIDLSQFYIDKTGG